MPVRRNITSGAPWESIVGYCRAVRVGPHIAVTGTASVGENGAVFAVGDAYGQARRCIEMIDPDMLVEIEADAIVIEQGAS